MIRSHIVPRHYLDCFTNRSGKDAGRLWVYEKRRAPRQGTSNSEGAENGYFAYQHPSGKFDESLESVLANIEAEASETLRIARSVCFVWSAQRRRRLAGYIGLMFAR